MKRIFVITVLCFVGILCFTAGADNYKILWTNHPDLIINGKVAKVGDIFSDTDRVKWAKERHAMKVVNLTTRRQYVVSAHSIGDNSKTFKELLLRINHMSTHIPAGENVELNLIDRLSTVFDSAYDLYDYVYIDVDPEIILDENHYFVASYRYGDTRIIKKLRSSEANVIIDRSIFNIDDNTIDARDISLDIEYIDDATGKTYFVRSDVAIYIIPEQL